MILNEHKYRPITGTVLTIGRQSVGLTAETTDILLQRMGVPKRDIQYQVDEQTIGVSRALPYITQESFFAAFTDAKVASLDVSAYENADVVCDMQGTIPEQYLGYADFIYNGSGDGYDCSSVELFSRYEIHCIAEKAASSTHDRNPIQKHYRVDRWHNKICLKSARKFRDSQRPNFSNDVDFDVASIPRIDSSDYPQQMRCVAVFPSGYPLADRKINS